MTTDVDWKDALLHQKDGENPFRFLDEGQLETVVAYLERVHLPAGEVLFEEGDKGDFFAIIAGGRLEAKKKTEFAGNQIMMAVLGKGTFVGELAMVDDQPRAATVRAIEDTDLFVLRRDRFKALTAEHPDVGIRIYQAISRILSIRLRTLGERFADIF